jgi:hypothetical protein
MSSHRSANGTATDDARLPSRIAPSKRGSAEVGVSTYGSPYTIASLGLDTGVRCAEGQCKRADRTPDDSDGTTHLIMIDNVDVCGGHCCVGGGSVRVSGWPDEFSSVSSSLGGP